MALALRGWGVGDMCTHVNGFMDQDPGSDDAGLPCCLKQAKGGPSSCLF